MSSQIAVRLPDEIVRFVDSVVAAGEARSRAEVVSRALQRERRRRDAERDAAIYAADAADGDLDALAEHASRTALDDLD